MTTEDCTVQHFGRRKISDEINDRARKAWMNGGGELISLPADEQSAMLEILASVGEDVSKTKPQLSAAYLVATEAAQSRR